MITAHGASDCAINAAPPGPRSARSDLPVVKLAHLASGISCDGYHPVIIGQRDHVEVRGLTGDCLTSCWTSPSGNWSAPRIGVAAQTTQPADRVSA
jgi:4-hydroxy-3-methylbut-2-enyl diphosphate reductase